MMREVSLCGKRYQIDVENMPVHSWGQTSTFCRIVYDGLSFVGDDFQMARKRFADYVKRTCSDS